MSNAQKITLRDGTRLSWDAVTCGRCYYDPNYGHLYLTLERHRRDGRAQLQGPATARRQLRPAGHRILWPRRATP
jgi:hypothetical protein